MLVTAYYDIYNKPHKFFEYVSLFYDLGISGIPIVLFTDPSFVYKFRIFPSTVHIVAMPLNSFELYRIGMNYNRDLPDSRTPEKDTKEFFSLMNTKIEFVKKASELYPDVEQFSWIDFGILKIVRNTDRFIKRLQKIDESSYSKIMIPGCWAQGLPMDVNAIQWRFCGGFLLIPKQFIPEFFQHSKNVLNDFCTMSQYKLTWETNVWYIIEVYAEQHNIEWYYADHDDSMILNMPISV